MALNYCILYALGVLAKWSKVLIAVPLLLMVWSTLALGTYQLRFISWVFHVILSSIHFISYPLTLGQHMDMQTSIHKLIISKIESPWLHEKEMNCWYVSWWFLMAKYAYINIKHIRTEACPSYYSLQVTVPLSRVGLLPYLGMVGYCQVNITSLSTLHYLTDIYITFLKSTSPHCQVYITSLSSQHHLTFNSTSPHCLVYITSISSLHFTVKSTSPHCSLPHLIDIYLISLKFTSPHYQVLITSLSSVHHTTVKYISPHCQVYIATPTGVHHLTVKCRSPHCQVYIATLTSVHHLTVKYKSPHCQVYTTSLTSKDHLTVTCSLPHWQV